MKHSAQTRAAEDIKDAWKCWAQEELELCKFYELAHSAPIATARDYFIEGFRYGRLIPRTKGNKEEKTT